MAGGWGRGGFSSARVKPGLSRRGVCPRRRAAPRPFRLSGLTQRVHDEVPFISLDESRRKPSGVVPEFVLACYHRVIGSDTVCAHSRMKALTLCAYLCVRMPVSRPAVQVEVT